MFTLVIKSCKLVNKKMVRFIFLICLLPLYCIAQQNPNKNFRDSLKQTLGMRLSDSMKARNSFLLTEDWSYTDKEQSKKYLDLGKKYAAKDVYLQAIYSYFAGKYYYDIDFPRAKASFHECIIKLKPYTSKEAWYFKGKAWRNYGVIFQMDDDDKTFLKILTENAIPAIIKSGDKNLLAIYYADVGLIFRNQWQYDEAARYFDKALAILTDLGDKNRTSSFIYLDAATNLLYANKLAEAKKLIDRSEHLILPESETEVIFYQTKGLYYRKMRAFQLSLTSLDRGFIVAKKIKSEILASNITYQRYKTLKDMGDYQAAKTLLLNKLENKVLESNQDNLMYYYELADISALMKDSASAYLWQKKYSTLLDSTSEAQLKKEIGKIEIKFRSVENQKRIAELKLNNERAESTLKNSRMTNWILVLTSFSLLLIGSIGWLSYKNSRKLSAQIKKNHLQELKDIEQQQRINISKAMLQAQEGERTRVARDLHDGLGSMLAGVKINLSGIVSEKDKQYDQRLHDTMAQLDSSVTELRRIAHNMMPEILLRYGLEESLIDLCESIISRKIAVDLQCLNIQQNIAINEQLYIYRIIQELLTNIVKHAEANTILLQCSQRENVFLITMEDDGKGFDTGQLDSNDGVGISNIKNRVAYLNGTIEYRKKNPSGTIVNIELYVTG